MQAVTWTQTAAEGDAVTSIRCVFCADPITAVEPFAVVTPRGHRAHGRCAGAEHTVITPRPMSVPPVAVPNIDREFCVFCGERISPHLLTRTNLGHPLHTRCHRSWKGYTRDPEKAAEHRRKVADRKRQRRD